MSDALGDPTCVRLDGEPTVTLRIWAVGEDEPQVHEHMDPRYAEDILAAARAWSWFDRGEIHSEED